MSLQLSKQGTADLLSSPGKRDVHALDLGRTRQIVHHSEGPTADGLTVELGHQQRAGPIHDVGSLEAEDERPGFRVSAVQVQVQLRDQEFDIDVVEPNPLDGQTLLRLQ